MHWKRQMTLKSSATILKGLTEYGSFNHYTAKSNTKAMHFDRLFLVWDSGIHVFSVLQDTDHSFRIDGTTHTFTIKVVS